MDCCLHDAVLRQWLHNTTPELKSQPPIDFSILLVYNNSMEIYVVDNAKKLREQALVLQRIAKEMRREEIRNLRKEGLTLEEIGKRYKISKERVRQILLDEK